MKNIVFCVCCGLLALSCGDDDDDSAADAGGDADADGDTDTDADSDGDADGDTDADSDSDTDADSDGDSDSVSCGVLPTSCDDIGSGWDDLTGGCCWDNVVYWCGLVDEIWVMQSQDCDEFEMTCAYSESDGFVWCED